MLPCFEVTGAEVLGPPKERAGLGGLVAGEAETVI